MVPKGSAVSLSCSHQSQLAVEVLESPIGMRAVGPFPLSILSNVLNLGNSWKFENYRTVKHGYQNEGFCWQDIGDCAVHYVDDCYCEHNSTGSTLFLKMGVRRVLM
jgi:hypothetical protein